MSLLRGKISTFGSDSDSGMTKTEGLSIYEHHEADLRPDLFNPRSSDETLGTSQRMKPDTFYFAYRFPLNPRPDRKALQGTQWLFRNPQNGRMATAWLIDYGPNENTGRFFDLSPGLANALQLSTDQLVEAVPVSEISTLFVA